MKKTILACLASAVLAFTVAAQASDPKVTLFTNVNVFDGSNEKLIRKANVLVEGNLIKTVSTVSITAEGATVIDGGGRTLMPGLIYMHEHMMFQLPSAIQMINGDPYKQGKLGVIEEGAYADMLLVDGNPLEDITVAVNPDNFRVIMKDGAVYKNTLK